MEAVQNRGTICLVTRVASRACAVPLEMVHEIMRPLPIEPLAGAPSFVLGLSVVRGSPVPVVDAARLLGATSSPVATRFVSMRVGTRRAALAVEEVVGVRGFDRRSLESLPPLMGEVDAHVVEAVGTLDASFLVLLRTGRIVPPSLWAALDRGTAS